MRLFTKTYCMWCVCAHRLEKLLQLNVYLSSSQFHCTWFVYGVCNGSTLHFTTLFFCGNMYNQLLFKITYTATPQRNEKYENDFFLHSPHERKFIYPGSNYYRLNLIHSMNDVKILNGRDFFTISRFFIARVICLKGILLSN